MNRDEKLEMLQKFDEEQLTKKFIIPLYESERMGYKNIQYIHGILEFGKDIVCYKEDEYGKRIYVGVQVKARKITNRSVDTILRQVFEALGKPFTDPHDGKEKILDKIVLAMSHELKDKAKDKAKMVTPLPDHLNPAE